jgi:hypothetical protein
MFGNVWIDSTPQNIKGTQKVDSSNIIRGGECLSNAHWLGPWHREEIYREETPGGDRNMRLFQANFFYAGVIF